MTPTDRPFLVHGLDGVRALAVSLVILFHLSPGALPGGYLGVDVFFVVSGFLITALLLREQAATGRIALRAFWVRRARRLLPALALLLLACCAAALLVGGDVLVGLGLQVTGATTFSSNWLFLSAGSSYFDTTMPELFRNLWSLAVEEQFYLVWPLLVLVLVRIPRWLRLVGIGAIAAASAVSMALLWNPLDATRVYYGTDTHAFGLAIGAFLAVLVTGRATSPGRVPVRAGIALAGGVAIAALVGLSFLLPEDSPLVFRGGLVVVALLSAVAIAALLVRDSPVARVLDVAPVRWVGVRSYGLYLWHWPAFVLVTAAFPAWPRDGASGWALGGIALGITVAAAAFSYRFVEEPIRRAGFGATANAILDVPPRTRRAAVAIAALLLSTGAAGLSVAAVVSDPGQGEVQALVEAGEKSLADAEAPPPAPAPAPLEQAEPVPQLVGGEQITAIGDSIMLAAAPTLQQEFPGIAIDAAVSRSMYAAPAILQQQLDSGSLRPVVVLALGTNGPITPETLEHVHAMIGPDRQLVVVNAQAPRGWIPGVNSALSSFAQRYREVELANWHGAIQSQLGLLARDQVHFGTNGALVFASTIRDALQRLAELPPVRDERADLSLPTPF